MTNAYLSAFFVREHNTENMKDFILANWAELLIGLMAFVKIVVNLTPTEKDNQIFGWLDTLIDAIVPSRKK